MSVVSPMAGMRVFDFANQRQVMRLVIAAVHQAQNAAAAPSTAAMQAVYMHNALCHGFD